MKFCASVLQTQPSFSLQQRRSVNVINGQPPSTFRRFPPNRTNRPKPTKKNCASLSHVHHLALRKDKHMAWACIGMQLRNCSSTYHRTWAWKCSELPTWNSRFFLPASSWFLFSKAFLFDSDMSIQLHFITFLYVSVSVHFLCFFFGVQVAYQLRALLIFHQNGLSKGS